MPENSNKQPLEIKREDFALWKMHPITKEVLKELRETRAALKDALSSGQTLTGEAGATAEKTARMIGNIEGIEMLLELQFEDEEGASYEMPD